MKKRKEREPLSITKQYTIRYCLSGITWLMSAIFSLSDNQVMQIIASVFMLFATICTFIEFIPNREHDDEMSLQHINKAKSLSLDLTLILLLAVGICSILFDGIISYRKVYIFIMAFSQIAAGLLFCRFEKGGE